MVVKRVFLFNRLHSARAFCYILSTQESIEIQLVLDRDLGLCISELMQLVLHLKRWSTIWFCVLVRFLQFKQLLMTYNLHLCMLLLVINVLRDIVSI